MQRSDEVELLEHAAFQGRQRLGFVHGTEHRNSLSYQRAPRGEVERLVREKKCRFAGSVNPKIIDWALLLNRKHALPLFPTSALRSVMAFRYSTLDGRHVALAIAALLGACSSGADERTDVVEPTPPAASSGGSTLAEQPVAVDTGDDDTVGAGDLGEGGSGGAGGDASGVAGSPVQEPAPPVDAGAGTAGVGGGGPAEPEAPECIEACETAGAQCLHGACVFDCSGAGSCDAVACPLGLGCEVACGDQACGSVQCPLLADANCVVDCKGQGSCGAVYCEALQCDVSCEGDGSCGTLEGGAPVVTVQCSGHASCATDVELGAQSATVVCSGLDSCSAEVSLSGDDIAITCSGEDSCGDVSCAAGICSLSCEGPNSCAKADCSGESILGDCP